MKRKRNEKKRKETCVTHENSCCWGRGSGSSRVLFSFFNVVSCPPRAACACASRSAGGLIYIPPFDPKLHLFSQLLSAFERLKFKFSITEDKDKCKGSCPIPSQSQQIPCTSSACVLACVRAAFDAITRARPIAHQSACVDLYNADEPATLANSQANLGTSPSLHCIERRRTRTA